MAQRSTPQTQQAHPRQKPNNAGGYSFQVDGWTRLNRFLTAGTAGGTFYVSETNLTEENAQIVHDLLQQDATRVINSVVEVSDAGRALKQDYGIFVLALAASSPNVVTRKLAYAAIPKVCRTASTLTQLLSYLKGRRGWSRGLRNAVSNWYEQFDPHGLAYQMTKYANRNGWNQYDVLNMAHPKQHNAVFKYVVGYKRDKGIPEGSPRILQAVAQLRSPEGITDRAAFIAEHKLVREQIPTEWLNDIEIQRALFESIPMGNLLRNLGTYTASGLLTGTSEESLKAVAMFNNDEAIAKSRLHPIGIYLAQAIYGSGHGFRGSLSWAPVNKILDALGVAFEKSFKNVTPMGGSVLVAVDTSGSMGGGYSALHYSGYEGVAGTPLTPAQVCAALATVHAHTEPNATFLAFDTSYYPVSLSSDASLERVTQTFGKYGGGGTDCSLPIQYAIDKQMHVDTFVIYTDSETWAGWRDHPHQALAKYRAKHNPKAKIAICSTTATGHSIADDNDPMTFQVGGFDASVPQLLGAFARGEI